MKEKWFRRAGFTALHLLPFALLNLLTWAFFPQGVAIWLVTIFFCVAAYNLVRFLQRKA